jgi:hypothetical protein
MQAGIGVRRRKRREGPTFGRFEAKKEPTRGGERRHKRRQSEPYARANIRVSDPNDLANIVNSDGRESTIVSAANMSSDT